MSSDEDRMLGVVGCWRTSGERQTAQSLEQRVKQLQEELKCQAQNSNAPETWTSNTRDLDKQHQRLTLQKQALERDTDALKEKVKWTEGELKDSQKKEAQTQTKLTESLCEREGLNVTLEQNRRRETGLEEEVKKLAEELAEALRCIKEIEDKNSLSTQSSLSDTDHSPHLTSPAGSDTDYESETLSSHSKPRAQTTGAEGDLQRENRELRSELQDVKHEARTRLKQLSRKHASQAETSREKERRGELEERAETGG